VFNLLGVTFTQRGAKRSVGYVVFVQYFPFHGVVGSCLDTLDYGVHRVPLYSLNICKIIQLSILLQIYQLIFPLKIWKRPIQLDSVGMGGGGGGGT
jgi:hypothetical protein